MMKYVQEKRRMQREIKGILETNSKKLGLDRFKIKHNFDLENENYGEVYINDAHNFAEISFNIAKLLSEKSEVLPTVIHELLHIFFFDSYVITVDLVRKLVHDPNLKELFLDKLETNEHKQIFRLEGLLGVKKRKTYKNKDKKKVDDKPDRKDRNRCAI